MKVKLASQVFSHSVSAALKTYVASNDFPESALGTADLCQGLNDVYDVLNSNTRFSAAQYKRSISPVDTPHIYQFIDDSIRWLKTWKIYNSKGEVINGRFKFLNGLILDLSTVRDLSLHLHDQNGFSYLMTRRLCTDGQENFFSILR